MPAACLSGTFKRKLSAMMNLRSCVQPNEGDCCPTLPLESVKDAGANVDHLVLGRSDSWRVDAVTADRCWKGSVQDL
jgi:hypothetical protein